jgi:hypothetical protein
MKTSNLTLNYDIVRKAFEPTGGLGPISYKGTPLCNLLHVTADVFTLVADSAATDCI